MQTDEIPTPDRTEIMAKAYYDKMVSLGATGASWWELREYIRAGMEAAIAADPQGAV